LTVTPRHHDRLDRRAVLALDVGPPGVDVAAHVLQAGVLVVQVEAHRAAAARLGRFEQLHAEHVEHACGGGVDVGRHRRLHAARQHQHLARVLARGPGSGFVRGLHLVAQAVRQQRTHRLPRLEGRLEQGGARQEFLQHAALDAIVEGALDALLDHPAADVGQASVPHAGRTGGLAVEAGEAAVQVQLGLAGGLDAFEHLLDQVDAATRAIELVAQQLVSRASGGAEAAVHAGAQDGVGLVAFRRALDEIGEIGLHGSVRLTFKPSGRG
jgi:hypothetical protein